MLNEEPRNEITLDDRDTPTERATINQIAVDELDAWLEQIRERRLQRVQQLEAIAKVKSDEVRLEMFVKYERLYARAKRALSKLEAEEQKVEKVVHQCRLIVMAMQMEVGMEEEQC